MLLGKVKMAERRPAIIQEGQPTVDSTLMPLEGSLLSMEKLDRASPELWPEQNKLLSDMSNNSDGNNNQNQSDDSDVCSVNNFSVPGLSGYAPLQSPNQPPPQWNRGFTSEDMTLMHQLSALSTSSIILEVKKLHDLAYRLGIDEAKEMTRGKYLNVFTSRKSQYDY